MNANTWKKEGVRKRWSVHRNKPYSRDGMVVLAAVPKETVPAKLRGKDGLHQEQYTLALEQMLIHHFKLFEEDVKIANSTFSTGGTDRKESVAYALYIAFRFSDEESDTASDMDTGPSTCDEGDAQNDPCTSMPQKNGQKTITDFFKRCN